MPDLPRLYSDHDVAGMIYGPGDDPDVILAAFMRLLLTEGWDVLGILQRRVEGATHRNQSVEFVLVPESEWPAVPQQAQRPSGRVSDRLPDLGGRISAALARKPDLILLNRFGRAELAGTGLVGLLSDALIDQVPIAIAVPVGLRDRWITATGGLAVTVGPDPTALLGWWRSLGNGPVPPARRPDGCRHDA